MYKIDNPPDAIKNLPAHGKSIWITAYNAAYEQYAKDEAKSNATAWTATKNVYEQDEKGNWIEIKKVAYDYISVIELSDVVVEPEVKTSWIDIIREGTWQHQKYGIINITVDKLKKLAENFTNRILGRDVSITIEHNDELGRIGEYKEVKIENGKLRGLIEWTEKGIQLLSDKAFKYFSPEYVENYIDKETKDSRGACLVGGSVTNKPFLTGLSPILMSEAAMSGDMQIMSDVFAVKMAEGDAAAVTAQRERSDLYGIGIKENSYLSLPGNYGYLTDGQFADPVNYRYPIDQEEILHSYRNFIGFYGYNGEANSSYYTEDEKKIISARIYARLPVEYQAKAQEIMTFAEVDTEQVKANKTQAARSTKYGIGIKDNTSITIPSKYAGLTDDQFADPVNYAYPIDATHVLAAYKYFAKVENQAVYTPVEVKIIAKRIVAALPDAQKETASATFKLSEEGGINMDELKVAQDQIKALELQLSEGANKTKVIEDELWQAKVDATIKQFSDEMKVYPFEMPYAKIILSCRDTTEVIKLTDTTGKEIAMTAREAYMEILRQRPAVIELSERARSGGAKEMAAVDDAALTAQVRADMTAAGHIKL